jgi:hypothetical protein
MSILIKGLGHENTCYILLVYLSKMSFLIKCQAEDLVKMDKCPLKWPWLNQIDHYDLTLNQMSHTHLMT